MIIVQTPVSSLLPHSLRPRFTSSSSFRLLGSGTRAFRHRRRRVTRTSATGGDITPCTAASSPTSTRHRETTAYSRARKSKRASMRTRPRLDGCAERRFVVVVVVVPASASIRPARRRRVAHRRRGDRASCDSLANPTVSLVSPLDEDKGNAAGRIRRSWRHRLVRRLLFPPSRSARNRFPLPPSASVSLPLKPSLSFSCIRTYACTHAFARSDDHSTPLVALSFFLSLSLALT